jgi:hypothetical protein
MIRPKTTFSSSGVGGARMGAGAGRFFFRGPLLSPEDAGGGGGAGAAASGSEGGAGSSSSANASTSNGGERTFTQAQVDAIVQERLARAQKPKATQQPTQTQAEPAGETLSLRSLQAQLDEERQRRQFDRRASKLGLDESAADDLYDLYRAQKPSAEQQDTWFAEKAKRFGAGQQSTSQQQNSNAATEQQQAAAEGQKPPAAAPRAPGAVETFSDPGGLVDIYRMDVNKLSQLPPGKIREFHERNVSLSNQSIGAPPMPRIGSQQKR